MANFIPLSAIAAMGSAGFLLIFMAVNVANVLLAGQTESRAWISIFGALACGGALLALCVETALNPVSRWHLWILVGMIVISLAIEAAYRAATGRTIRLVKNRQ